MGHELDRIRPHLGVDGRTTFSFHEKKTCDVLWDHWLGSQSALLKTVRYSASWVEVFGQDWEGVGQAKAICTNRAQIIRLPEALFETSNLPSKVGAFCVEPTIENFSEIGFSAAKAGSKWADFLAGLFSVLQDPRAGLCKTIRYGLASIVDIKKIHANMVDLGALEGDGIEVFSKQIELCKDVVALLCHGFSFGARVLLGLTISPIIALFLGSLHLIMVVVNKIFYAEVENSRQYGIYLGLPH